MLTGDALDEQVTGISGVQITRDDRWGNWRAGGEGLHCCCGQQHGEGGH